jgi:hypothetical protein
MSGREVIEERSAHRVADHQRLVERQRIQNVAEVIDQRIDRVLRRVRWLVGEAVTFEVYGDGPETGISERGKSKAVRVNRAAPPGNHEDRWRGGIADLYRADG